MARKQKKRCRYCYDNFHRVKARCVHELTCVKKMNSGVQIRLAKEIIT